MSDTTEGEVAITWIRSRYSYGGLGSHWNGCHKVHWDCRIAWLEKQMERAVEIGLELATGNPSSGEQVLLIKELSRLKQAAK